MLFKHWLHKASSETTNEVLLQVAGVYVDRIDDPDIRGKFASYLGCRDYRSICEYALDYTHVSVSTAQSIRQVQAFFQKRQDLDLGIDREKAAWETWVKSEHSCRYENNLWNLGRDGISHFPRGVDSVLHAASRKIADVLGDVPDLATLRARFGPGATTSTKRSESHPLNKLSGGFACSEELASGLIGDCLSELPAWCFTSDRECESISVGVTPGKLVFVPKNYKTHRGVIIEPVLNTMFQGGIGEYMAKRLRKFNVDIRDQSRNQRLALEGSVTNRVATIDLSSASDSIAIGLVADLLPIDWFLFLSEFRTGSVEYKGRRYEQNKFCSMGNGFTFPLETLLFWSLTWACCQVLGVSRRDTDRFVSVYGDDIICPVEVVPLLVTTLMNVGFSVNIGKSFCDGPFRESCGKDYLRGIDIRPTYVKGRLDAMQLFTLHNQLYARCEWEMCRYLRGLLAPQLCLYGPSRFGDGHLHSDFDYLYDSWGHYTPVNDPLRPIRKNGYGGYVFDTFRLAPRRVKRVGAGERVLPFYMIYEREGADPLEETHSSASQKGAVFVITLPGEANRRKYVRQSIYTFS